MYDIRSAVQALNLNRMSEERMPPLKQITALSGHYRLDHFDQEVLEDMRQRLSRKGVSLNEFRSRHLNVIYTILQESLKQGWIRKLPPLFSYDLPEVFPADYAGQWLDDYQDKSSPATFARYGRLLRRELLPRFGQTDLRDLNGEMVARFKAEYLAAGGKESGFLFLPRILYLILDFVVEQAIAEAPNSAELDSRNGKPLWLKDVARQWLNAAMEPDKTDVQREIEEIMLPLIGWTDLRKMGQRKLRDYKNLLARNGYGSQVFRSQVKLLDRIQNYAMEQKLIESVPKVRAPKRKRMVGLNRLRTEDAAALMDDQSENPDLVILHLAWQLGLKNREICSLKWADLDLENRKAFVSGRIIPIPDGFVPLLGSLKQCGGGHGFVVLSAQKKMSPVSIAYIDKAAKKILCRHGLEKLTLEDLRSDYAIRLLQDHTPKEAAKQCGYQDSAEFSARFVDYISP